MKSFDKLYEQILTNEGILDRVGARLKGFSAGVSQPFKNIGAAIKGDKESIANPKEVSRTAKLQSIATSSVKNMLNDLHKTGFMEQPTEDQIKKLSDSIVQMFSQTAEQQPSTPSTSSPTTNSVQSSVNKAVEDGGSTEEMMQKISSNLNLQNRLAGKL